MAKKFENHTFAGLQRDVSVSKHPVTFLYDARNIRLTAREGKDTLLSITNEKGTEDTKVTIQGTYLGHCLLNNYLVVFSADKTSTPYADYIYRIDLSVSSLTKVTLFKGKLNFQLDHPLDVVGSFESSTVQKVYWTDNYNQPRVINICSIGKYPTNQNYNYSVYTSLDFVPELQLNETVTVQKMLGATGMFAPGVIQYAFTYYNKYGQESNIFYTTPLLYTSYKERGASPEDKVENAFRITVNSVDKNFDYLRIYSIQRTSLNGTPICKRIQDIDLTSLGNGTSVSYIDNGYSGDTVDPTELLYKGGEVVKAETIEQKDGTLFLGGITIERNSLETLRQSIQGQLANNLSAWDRKITGTYVSDAPYYYANQLTITTSSEKQRTSSGGITSYVNTNKTVPCGGFKFGDYYRCGIQFQHKTGKWSDPIWVGDYQIKSFPSVSYSTVVLPCIELNLPRNITGAAYAAGYRRVRPVVVFPQMQDRLCVCQGVANPTMYTPNHRNTDKDLYAQSSWFFRPYYASENNSVDASTGSVRPTSHDTLPYAEKSIRQGFPGSEDTQAWIPSRIRQIEIQGHFLDGNKFRVDTNFFTFHSPDVEFDDSLQTLDFTDVRGNYIGDARIDYTLSDIDIQTETPTVSNAGSGFVHKAFNMGGAYGIVAGLFYDDYILDDWEDKIAMSKERNSPFKWFVYPWHKSGSLNNDCTRPANFGTQTAKLKKKVISNLRYMHTEYTSYSQNSDYYSNFNYYYNYDNFTFTVESTQVSPQLFSSDQPTILKIGNKIYQGNIDTSIIPDNADGVYFAFSGSNLDSKDVVTPFTATSAYYYKTFSKDPDNNDNEGVYHWENNEWKLKNGDYGDHYVDIVMKKEPVRMKYKSTPHIIFGAYSTSTIADYTQKSGNLPIVEIRRTVPSNMFGGNSDDALKENTWIPCGEPTAITSSTSGTEYIHYIYGDTYFQRYDCLKTYPFTREDPNQIVEIGSFMLETRVNIDGRYDRNRGQSNNMNMSPQNFNLINKVYSQQDNFFNYKILPEDYYDNNSFPNQITWTKEKQTNADIDLWTNVTLASTYDMDGSKGAITSLNTWKDQIFCFQKKGVSNILFNSRVQIPTSDDVPIEISNSYKVDGYRYISDGIGCNTKLQVKETTSGIYFIDSVSGHLHHVGDGIRDVAAGSNMTTWFREHGKDTQRLFYDDVNHDLYVVQENTALCFSELLSQFTSFMDYGDTSLIESCDQNVFTMKDGKLFKMFSGEYCDFFGTYQTVNNNEVYVPNNKPWGLTFISNGSTEGMTDKVFTNLEFRACVDGDGVLETVIPEGETDPVETGKFIFNLPVDYIETWNEYQHGFANLEDRNGSAGFQHHNEDGDATLKRKFRIWRCDIPRNNCQLGEPEEGETWPYPYSTDASLGISRHIRKPLDRMRNPWLYIKLQKNAAGTGTTLKRTELHDMVVTYFS